MGSDVISTSFEPKPMRGANLGFAQSDERRDTVTPAAWEASFTAALPLLKIMLRRYLKNESDILEAVQQTALQATARRHQFRAEASLSTWLVSIALNEARQLLRKQNRQHTTVSLDLLDSELWDRHACSPEEAAHRAERQTRVSQAIGKLPPRYQTVVRLCELEEHSIEQTAQLLQITPTAVKSRRFRARRLLARYLYQPHGLVNAST